MAWRAEDIQRYREAEARVLARGRTGAEELTEALGESRPLDAVQAASGAPRCAIIIGLETASPFTNRAWRCMWVGADGQSVGDPVADSFRVYVRTYDDDPGIIGDISLSSSLFPPYRIGDYIMVQQQTCWLRNQVGEGFCTGWFCTEALFRYGA